jgi:hypothetical protein
MNVFRKIMGLLLIVFVGLPLLFGIIWAVGLTKAAVSPEFVSDFPQEIIREVPGMIDTIFEEAKDEDVITDSNTRAWFEAAARVDVSPRELMERIGLLDWMNHELSDLLDDIGDILRGTRRARNLIVDLQPLKDALQHEEFYNYLRKVLDNLPPCDEAELEKWERSVWSGSDWFDRPACRPDQATYEAIIENIRDEIVYDIPNEISILENVRFFPFGISRVVTWLSYALFLIPALVIFLASFVAATSPASFFRWSGISVFLGGLSGLVLSLLTGQAARWAVFFRPYSDTWSSDLQNLVIDKTEWIQLAIIDHLFSPVVVVAGAVCVVGFLLFILSFIARSQKSSVSSSQPVPVRQETAKPKTFDAVVLGTDEPESSIPDKVESIEQKTDEPESTSSADNEESEKD